MCECMHDKKLGFLNETYWVIVYLRAQAINVRASEDHWGQRERK